VVREGGHRDRSTVAAAIASASKTFMRASSGVQVLRFLGIRVASTGNILARRSATSYLVFPGAKATFEPL
jgi:hypothetical protein